MQQALDSLRICRLDEKRRIGLAGDQLVAVRRQIFLDEQRIVLRHFDAVGAQQLRGDAACPALAGAGEDALALEVAQALRRHVGAHEHPDRLIEKPAHRAQLAELLALPLLRFAAREPPLHAADETALDEAGVDDGVFGDQSL